MPTHQEETIKIGVLYPKEGAVSAYEDSLGLAIEAVREQIQGNAALPRIEFLSGFLVNNQAENQRSINNLVSEGVVAIIAPNLLSALITAAPGKLDVVPLVAKVDLTANLAAAGEHSLYRNLAQSSEIRSAFQRLKYRGNLANVTLLYDSSDRFGRLVYDLAVQLLTEEGASFATEVFDADKEDVANKLAQISSSTPQATLIVIASAGEVADVIYLAHEEMGITGEIIGILGDGNPTIFDLADTANNRVSGIGWDILPATPVATMISERFHSDRFAADSYIAVWTVLKGTDPTVAQPRATVRNALAVHGSQYFDQFTAQLARWWLDAARHALNERSHWLSFPQISHLNWSIAADLE